MTVLEALRIVLDASSIQDAAEFYPSWSPTERAAWDLLVRTSALEPPDDERDVDDDKEPTDSEPVRR